MNENEQETTEATDWAQSVADGIGEDEKAPATADEQDVEAVDDVEQEPQSAEVDSDIAKLEAERDSYLEASRRIQAEFENYRKQVAKRETDSKARAAEALVVEILPVLDACDAAVDNGSSDVEPIGSALFNSLQKLGLERAGSVGDSFDPVVHEAVSQIEAAEGNEGPTVSEVMRSGYVWKGRTLRPAMVQVSG